ncbi:DUF167 domain-containing protein [candidate division WOR-3 bacterium]|nr:DUF167 domain-containing protein [candidate division WOR-3 bacterium]
MHLRVFVKPKSRKESVTRNPDGTLTIAVRAAPVEDKANQAVIAALAQFLHRPKTSIRLVQGRTSRWKLFEVLD